MTEEWRVKLTYPEVMSAALVGVMRQVKNLRVGRKDRYGCDPEDGWTFHIEGACGEMAVAKATRLYWSGAIDRLRADDVGQFQVRTCSRHSYRLLLHPDDPNDRAFVHVTGLAPNFWIRGWIYARDKQEDWWEDPSGKNRHAYFVPTEELRPFDELLGEGGG
jgi:hypothetical protein